MDRNANGLACAPVRVDRTTRATMVLPTEGFFPEPFSITPACMRGILARVCEHMRVDQRQIDLRFYGEHRPEPFSLPVVSPAGTAGLYEATQYWPRAAQYYRSRADAFEQLGRTERAEEDRAEAIQRDPWSAET